MDRIIQLLVNFKSNMDVNSLHIAEMVKGEGFLIMIGGNKIYRTQFYNVSHTVSITSTIRNKTQ